MNFENFINCLINSIGCIGFLCESTVNRCEQNDSQEFTPDSQQIHSAPVLKAAPLLTFRKFTAIHSFFDRNFFIEGFYMSKADKEAQKTIKQFWENVDQIGIDNLNHAFKARFISINLTDYFEEVIRRALPITPLKHLRVALRSSKTPLFIDYAHVKSALTGKNTRCFIFGRSGD